MWIDTKILFRINDDILTHYSDTHSQFHAIPSIIFETQDDETIQELASTMDPGVTFSTTDHRLKDTVYSLSTLNLVHQIHEKAGELVNVACGSETVEFR